MLRARQGTVTYVDAASRALIVNFGGNEARLSCLFQNNTQTSQNATKTHQVRYLGPEMDALCPAWAITVHKAQGCEFPVVALVLNSGTLLFSFDQ